jgi:hypothetical protein
MRSAGLKSRLCRLSASGLAVTALLGHALAMLLVSLLAQAPAQAGLPAYGEICTADGVVAGSREAGPAGSSEPAPERHPGGPLDACPVCTAFAQNGQADLPPAFALPAPRPVSVTQRPAQEAVPATAGAGAAQSRGPPAVA